MADRNPSGGYRNPVIPGFFPDPSVCRTDDGFVLATSSFAYFPGVPIFRSDDLVDWRQVGHALDRPSQLDLSNTAGWPGLGVYAPTVRFHDGRLWLIVTVTTASFTDAFHTFFVTADRAEGPWSEPVVLDIPHIDPDLAWDEQGRCYVHTAGILRFQIDDSSGEVLDGPRATWEGTGLQHPEAPHLFRRGSWWYLLIAEGGTERGHAVSIARAPAPIGPWEPCPANPILSHRSTSLPIQNTGHADLVEAEDGSWWMVLLGVRPRGATPGFHVLGRETFLVPVDWVEDWPVPGDLEAEMPDRPPGLRQNRSFDLHDDFDAGSLGPEWVTVRRPLDDEVSHSDRPGWLTLHGCAHDLSSPTPTLVATRQREHLCTARTVVELDGADEAGLCVLIDERHHYEVGVTPESIIVRARIGDLDSIVASRALPPAPIVLRIEIHDDHAGAFGPGPDRVGFGIESSDGGFDVLADLDGRYLSTEVASGFSGRVIGLYAIGGTARFDHFDLHGASEPSSAPEARR
jgi:xylan 1,4-beta-xylosidase